MKDTMKKNQKPIRNLEEVRFSHKNIKVKRTESKVKKKKKTQAYASLLYLYSKLELGTTGVIDLYLVSVESLTGRLFMIILASSSLH